jgi:hypothetical protein
MRGSSLRFIYEKAMAWQIIFFFEKPKEIAGRKLFGLD